MKHRNLYHALLAALITVSCRMPEAPQAEANHISLDHAAFEVRHFTRLSYHQEICRCSLCSEVPDIGWDCIVGEPNSPCECSVISEGMLSTSVQARLKDQGIRSWETVKVMNGTLFVKRGEGAVEAVSEVLEEFWEPCE